MGQLEDPVAAAAVGGWRRVTDAARLALARVGRDVPRRRGTREAGVYSVSSIERSRVLASTRRVVLRCRGTLESRIDPQERGRSSKVFDASSPSGSRPGGGATIRTYRRPRDLRAHGGGALTALRIRRALERTPLLGSAAPPGWPSARSVRDLHGGDVIERLSKRARRRVRRQDGRALARCVARPADSLDLMPTARSALSITNSQARSLPACRSCRYTRLREQSLEGRTADPGRSARRLGGFREKIHSWPGLLIPC